MGINLLFSCVYNSNRKLEMDKDTQGVFALTWVISCIIVGVPTVLILLLLGFPN